MNESARVPEVVPAAQYRPLRPGPRIGMNMNRIVNYINELHDRVLTLEKQCLDMARMLDAQDRRLAGVSSKKATRKKATRKKA